LEKGLIGFAVLVFVIVAATLVWGFLSQMRTTKPDRGRVSGQEEVKNAGGRLSGL
jgi:hypothetical protein